MTAAPRPFVVYWNNIPSPYMVERFNALAARGNLEFQAWFNERTLWRRWEVDESSWRFSYRYLPAMRLGRRRLHLPSPLLNRPPDVLVSLYAEPAFVLGWMLARLQGIKTCFRVLMTHDAWVRRNPLKEALKHLMFRAVHGIETPGRDGRDFALRYGAAPERIHFARHTVDIPHFRRLSAELRENGRDEWRDGLGLRGCVFVYVGRLWYGKGVQYLVDAFAEVQRRAPGEVSLLLVGDGPDEAALRERCAGLANVVFAGFRQKPELPRFLAAADVFVFPTLGDPYGLVVDEAMACGLPVISTTAAGEIRERVDHGENGYLVPPADSMALARRMLELAEQPGLREAMGALAAQSVASHTAEGWAQDFERLVERLLAEP